MGSPIDSQRCLRAVSPCPLERILHCGWLKRKVREQPPNLVVLGRDAYFDGPTSPALGLDDLDELDRIPSAPVLWQQEQRVLDRDDFLRVHAWTQIHSEIPSQYSLSASRKEYVPAALLELKIAFEARVEEVEVKNRNLLDDLDDAHKEIEKLELDRAITAEMAPALEE